MDKAGNMTTSQRDRKPGIVIICTIPLGQEQKNQNPASFRPSFYI